MALNKKEIIEYIINGNKADSAVTEDSEFVFVDFTSFCSGSCLYCEKSRNNWNLKRWRLTGEEIIEKFRPGYEAGKRSFLLYGGSDIYFMTDKICAIIKSIKAEYPDTELYVALGEKVYEDYQAIKEAGADGYVLFHRSANEEHFSKLHTFESYADFRKKLMPFLKEMGFKVGTGITAGWPYQTAEILAEDIQFVQDIEADLIVVDSFVPQQDTDFASFPKGDRKQQENIIKLINKLMPDTVVLSGLE